MQEPLLFKQYVLSHQKLSRQSAILPRSDCIHEEENNCMRTSRSLLYEKRINLHLLFPCLPSTRGSRRFILMQPPRS